MGDAIMPVEEGPGRERRSQPDPAGPARPATAMAAAAMSRLRSVPLAAILEGSLREAVEIARAQAALPRQCVAAARQAVEDQRAIEPDPFIDDADGAQRPNPEHPVWARELEALRALLDAATQAAAPHERALAAAEAAWAGRFRRGPWARRHGG